ncbi:hypothetical protein EYF80_002448 [Liparis tanakae]|uniref:Uncharacterized protein n=1 Tax=Liparis tanakae TaxID=230148 RepID=A0A4Z2JAQ7_9TELE|nr:hypothetical protein EYF80_002448 [Liparis tanakae]
MQRTTLCAQSDTFLTLAYREGVTAAAQVLTRGGQEVERVVLEVLVDEWKENLKEDIDNDKIRDMLSPSLVLSMLQLIARKLFRDSRIGHLPFLMGVFCIFVGKLLKLIWKSNAGKIKCEN